MRHFALSVFALAAVLSSPAFSETSEFKTLSGNYLASRTASRLLDLGASADFTNEALKQDQSNGILAERLFQTYVMEGELAKAEPLAAQVIKTNSQQRTARLVLGLKEFRARRYPEARNNFNEAAYTPIGVLTSALLNAWSYAGEGSLNAALHELDKLDGQDAFANYKAFHAALIADLLASPMRAEASYKKAYEVAPTSLRVVQAYGNFLERQGRKADAEKIYRSYLAGGQGNIFVQQALDNLPKAAKPAPFVATPVAGAGEVLFSVASSLNVDQSADLALIYSQLALSASNDKPFVLTTLAGVQSGLKRYEESNASYEQIPKDNLLRNYADTEIAMNLHHLDKSADAVARLKDVVARDPKNTDALITLAGIYRSTSQYTPAAETYSKVMDLLPASDGNNWRIFYDRGIAFDHMKDFEKSEADFRKALSLSKDDASVLNYLGYSMIDRGIKLDEALGMVKKAVSLKPNDGYITDSLGWAYYTLRDYEQAATYCERAVDLIPSDPIIAEHLGDVYWKVGRKLEANFQWQHALDNHPEANDVPRIQGKLKTGLSESVEAKPADAPPADGLAAAVKQTNG